MTTVVESFDSLLASAEGAPATGEFHTFRLVDSPIDGSPLIVGPGRKLEHDLAIDLPKGGAVSGRAVVRIASVYRGTAATFTNSTYELYLRAQAIWKDGPQEHEASVQGTLSRLDVEEMASLAELEAEGLLDARIGSKFNRWHAVSDQALSSRRHFLAAAVIGRTYPHLSVLSGTQTRAPRPEELIQINEFVTSQVPLIEA